MKLNLSSLEKALESLSLALIEYKKNSNEFIRDSCIQRFEYSYELSWKMVKRHLELVEADKASIDELAFPNLIRKANEKGLLLSNWSKWKVYREARNTTSHAYDKIKADAVFAIIPDFYKEMEYLYQQLMKYNNDFE